MTISSWCKGHGLFLLQNMKSLSDKQIDLILTFKSKRATTVVRQPLYIIKGVGRLIGSQSSLFRCPHGSEKCYG